MREDDMEGPDGALNAGLAITASATPRGNHTMWLSCTSPKLFSKRCHCRGTTPQVFSLSTESLGLSTTGLERASWTAKFASLLLPPLHWGNVDNERANAKRSGSSSYSTAGRLTMAPRWWKSPLKQRWPS